MRRPFVAILAALALALLASSPASMYAADPGVGGVPQGTQPDAAYAGSFAAAGVTNVSATTQAVSCYTPEVPYFTSNGPAEGYSGMSPCNGASTTGEDLGPYPTQRGSNPGSPASTPMLVKDHSESDIRVDPTNPSHLIASSKWAVSAEGYNHLLGFYESFDAGRTWPVQGHIPGYEGWTDNTDPVGAFDPWGNYYELLLPYQFFYDPDGSHNFSINPNQEPNPAEPAEVISVSVRPHGASKASEWITTSGGQPDIVAAYPNKGNEPDKQWITIDTNPGSAHFGRIYAMWVDFTGPFTAHPVVSFADARSDGTHTAWSAPIPLPQAPTTPQGATYLLPHVTPDEDYSAGVDNVLLSASYDNGATWSTPIQVNDNRAAVDEFQPNLAVAANGTVSVNFYDRRLTCPAAGTAEAAAAGLALDTANPKSPGVVPYGAANYCVDASVQFYGPALSPLGHNVRLTQHTWDPQLNALHPGSAGGARTFIGDYFGNAFAAGTDYATFVSTYDDGSNPSHRQQQVVAALTAPLKS